MSDGTTEQLTRSVEHLQELAGWIGGDREEDPVDSEDITRSLAEHYGVAEEDYYGDPEEFVGPDHEEVVLDAIREAALCIDTEIVKSVVFGTGGPHTEIEITLGDFSDYGDGSQLEVLRGRVVGYWGGDKVERNLSGEQVDAIADLFMLTEEV